MIGRVPAVIIGSFLSSRAPDHYLQPLITFVIFASGLKYVGLGTSALVSVLAAVLAVAGGYWLIRVRPTCHRAPAAADPALAAEPEPPVTAVHGPSGPPPAPVPGAAATAGLGERATP